ncbi:MAG: NAD-dependent succinate-semialdehyde dehydrogenase [Planctomycetota bacterium]|nr:MAG: NAD-dependent succinate-semialdehyde dehydrogenase [Planctomycetota bacterium]
MLIAIDPSSGEEVRRVKCDDTAAVEAKLAAAQAAAGPWAQRSFAQRAELLRTVATYLRDHRDQLGAYMTEEMGKPQREAVGEVDKAAWCAEHYAEHAASYLADEELASDATRSYVRYQPLGPVLGVLPWNAPFWLAFRFCAPALMAGNPALIKHDSHTPGCAQALEQVFAQVGAPAGLFQALYLENPQVEAVIQDSRIHAVSFTGSSRGGAAVASIAGAALKPTVLELGGSDPSILLPDADLDAAIPTICLSRMINAGQSCIAAKRIIAHASIYDDVVARMRTHLSGLRLGDPRSAETDIGPIAREDLRAELHRQVQDSVDAGAVLELGGTLPEGLGYFYPVTLLSNVSPEMSVFREETFGPVAVVIRASDEAHAVAMANDSDYGLAASVWGSHDAAWALGQQIATGQIVINGIVKTDPRLPSGGIKRSGYGRELGPHGIRAFVNAQQVWIGPKQDS